VCPDYRTVAVVHGSNLLWPSVSLEVFPFQCCTILCILGTSEDFCIIRSMIKGAEQLTMDLGEPSIPSRQTCRVQVWLDIML
jgi:hypothetical protein